MNILPIGSYDRSSAIRSLPPLVRGYLRVGAMIGEGAWVDHAFGTIDIFVVMPVETIAARYSDRFSSARIAA
jgi:putative hemolysin